MSRNRNDDTLVRVYIDDIHDIAKYHIGFLLNEFELNSELSDWMRINVESKWDWCEFPSHCSGKFSALFRFENAEEAMVFKLTWGGA